MTVAALIIGIFGSMAGFIGGILALFLGGVGAAFGAEDAGTVVGGSVAAIGLSILGLVGAALSIAKPRTAATLMIISAIGGLIAIFVAYILATILLVIAALFAFLGRKPMATASAD